MSVAANVVSNFQNVGNIANRLGLSFKLRRLCLSFLNVKDCQSQPKGYVNFSTSSHGYLGKQHNTSKPKVNAKHPSRPASSPLLDKWMLRDNKKKKWFMNQGNLRAEEGGGGSGRKRATKYSAGMVRRARHLSHILYTHVTGVVTSGELGEEIRMKNVEITKVELVPDLAAINVYWAPAGTAEDEEVQQLLSTAAPRLRLLLQQCAVLSSVPRVDFVKDKALAAEAEITRRLAAADYGPEYLVGAPGVEQEEGVGAETPVDYPDVVYLDRYGTPMGQDTGGEEEGRREGVKGAPDVPRTVYGLEHTAMMNKIRVLSKKERPSLQEVSRLPQFTGEVPVSGEVLQKELQTRARLRRVAKKKVRAHLQPAIDVVMSEAEAGQLQDWDEADYYEDEERFGEGR